MVELDEALERLAATPVMLVATDYDGTISPIVDDPERAVPQREAIVALKMLAAMPQTHVAVISGRALSDLARLTGSPDDVHLVGSHGSEFDVDFGTSLSPEASALRDRVEDELRGLADAEEGLTIEVKPASVALHYRLATDEVAEHAVERALEGPGSQDGVYVKHGKKVLELTVVAMSKADALERIRHRIGASAVVFLGDDLTDEEGFATLAGPDVGVKVGEGESRAAFRVADPVEVSQRLAQLCELRERWLEGARAVPIEQHALLSDQRASVLVSPDARVVWMCVPRQDSPAMFAELLGGPVAGYFSVAPEHGGAAVRQRYEPTSMVLETEFEGLTVTDFLDCSAGRPRQRAGRSDLVRILRGSGKACIELAPRVDFGRAPTGLLKKDGGLSIVGDVDPVVLRSPGVAWEIRDEGVHQTALATVDLDRGPVVLELRYGTGSVRGTVAETIDRERLTRRYWSAWSETLELPDIEPDLVRRSALVLKALACGPTGAIAAAATTSLPEHVGGVRNWDYRYCWPRDAAMAASSLVRLGSLDEAMHFLDWVLGVVDNLDSPERLRPLYTVRGSELGAEGEISELAGYCGSRPVRVGNLASRQVQLDVFGPIVELVALLAERDAPLSSDHFRLVEQMVLAVAGRWHEPDHGIWEIRGPRRHHVHSKVMGWLTADRAVGIARRFLERDREDWKALRDTIASDVLEHGYKPELRAFTAAYEGVDLDAATLMVGLTGLVSPDDERFVGTIAAIERHLLDGPTVYRYHGDDGLPGREGGFHLCASWLVQAYLLVGRTTEARSLFDQMVSLAGGTGVLSEQYDPRTGRALGNTPQAYSHLGLIDGAIALSTAR